MNKTQFKKVAKIFMLFTAALSSVQTISARWLHRGNRWHGGYYRDRYYDDGAVIGVGAGLATAGIIAGAAANSSESRRERMETERELRRQRIENEKKQESLERIQKDNEDLSDRVKRLEAQKK